MGCWNGTCHLSGLPIMSGEEVYLYILEKNKYYDFREIGGCFCYPTEAFYPVGIPVLGKYDDYGGVEEIANKEIAKAILKSVKFKGTLEELIRCIHENHRGDENIKALNELGDKVSNFRGYAYVTVLKSVFEKSLKVFEDHYSKRPYFELSTKEKKLSFDRVQERLLGYGEDNICTHEFLTNIGIERSFSAIETKFLGKQKKKVCKFKKEVMDHYRFCQVMSVMRRTWIPLSGGGSQDDSFEFHRDVNKVFLDTAKEIIKKRKEEDY